jgi:cyclic-di-GMP phosphodiesterase TipF (flagellum assembly factor)
MSRVLHFFITLCIAVTAGCFAVGLFLAGETSAVLAGILGAGVLALALIARSAWATRQSVRRLIDEIDDDRRALDAFMQRVERHETRLRAVEAGLSRTDQGPAAEEIATLGALVKELADAVSAHDARLVALSAVAERLQAPPARRPFPSRPAPPGPPGSNLPGPPPIASYGVPQPSSPRIEMAAQPPPDPAERAVVEAIDAGRLEIFLQPVMTLPQRKVRLYEAQVVLRSADGRAFAAADYGPLLEATGTAARLDGALVLRLVQIARRLAARHRDLLVVARLSPASLLTPGFVDEMFDLIGATSGLGAQTGFSFAQAEIAAMGGRHFEALRRLAALGCRFCVDRVDDLRLDGSALAGRGFRFVKVGARRLLDEQGAASEVHVADLAPLLARSGVELIADGIVSEAMVADLLDLDLALGQGDLFSPPRPVRPEVLSERGSPASPTAAALAGAAAVRQPDPAPGPPPAAPAPVTLGEVALQDVMARAQRGSDGPPVGVDAREDGRRSAWRVLARRVGAKDRS